MPIQATSSTGWCYESEIPVTLVSEPEHQDSRFESRFGNGLARPKVHSALNRVSFW